MAESTTAVKQRYRTIWISDIHLGTRGCQAEALLDFLKHNDAEKWYLVGDIFDGWRLRRRWHWPRTHNDVVQKLLRKRRKGARMVYIPGNHDEFLRDFLGIHLGGISLVDDDIHETADGKRLLVIHGDQFDGVVRYGKWLAKFGSWAYDLAVEINHWLNLLRRKLGLRYWSLSKFLKAKVKEAMKYISRFEEALAHEAVKRGADGVVCGHIHHAQIKRVGDVLYLNDGDWVESCTALVEHHDGKLEIVYWPHKH